MRIAPWTLSLIAAMSATALQAQPAAAPTAAEASRETPEEVIVRGQQIGELRVAVKRRARS